MSIALTHDGLPENCGRFDLLSLFEQVAKSHYRLSKTAIALVRHYVLRTSDEDYRKGRVCAVWSQVATTARAIGLTPRSINGAERELEDAGFLIRSTGGNGARYGERRDGRVIWASGINLAPLILRFHELQDRLQAIRLRDRAVDQCKAEIRQINRAIRSSEQIDLRAMADEILPHGRTARITDLDRLTAIRDALAEVLAMLRDGAGAQKISDGSEENCAPNIPPEQSSKTCSAGAPSRTPDLRMSPQQAALIATDEYREALAMFGGTTWSGIVETSFHMAIQMGIGQRSWQSACARLGREHAALCVIIIQRNAALSSGHRYHARKPAGCLAGMVKSTLAGTMNLAGMVAAIRDRKDEGKKTGRSEIGNTQDSITDSIFGQMAARYARCTRLS
ncbi:replication initiation protein RepC [Sphingobium baderi]|uniref:replication initiation protein RepC n=1 Tax=Sphingobium baderi TaxID=1332080 RepID=UPI002B40A23D|nr:replication initiation protein RepC [Sphingobium baderi]WRD75188.1 helix-turn-helix domain-containing protein [Sphingobium baderi]